MRDKILKFTLYPLFFLTCLIFFLIQGFPVEIIAERFVRDARQNLGMKLTYSRIGTMFPNGVEATGLLLEKESDSEDAEAVPLAIRVESLSARISLLSLLAGNRNVSFSSDFLAGSLEGSFVQSQDNIQLEAKFAGLNLARLAFLGQALGQELTGKLTGSINLDMKPKDIKSAKGDVVLELVQGKIGNGKAYGVNVPWISLGKTQATLSIQKGKAEIKSFKVSSDDLEASVDGYFLLQQKLQQLSSHCKLRFKPSDEKMAEIRKQIPPEFHQLLDRELDKARGKDGYYTYSIFGRLFGGKPQFRPLKK